MTMLAVHWSPVKNTKRILKNGIHKDRRGTFCFPLTGNAHVDRWWAQAFRAWRPRAAYNGFVFRILQDDMPAYFGHWIGHDSERSLKTVQELQAEINNTILWRIGERHIGYGSASILLSNEALMQAARRLIAESPQTYTRVLHTETDFLTYVFEDHEIILARSIAARRILYVLPGANESGRTTVRRRKESLQQRAAWDW